MMFERPSSSVSDKKAPMRSSAGLAIEDGCPTHDILCRVAGVAVVGDEDGQSRLIRTIPANAVAYWVGEAIGKSAGRRH
jgi:hypothetical protein